MSDDGLEITKIYPGGKTAIILPLGDDNTEDVLVALGKFVSHNNFGRTHIYIPKLPTDPELDLSDPSITHYDVDQHSMDMYVKIMNKYSEPNRNILLYELFDERFAKYDRVIYIGGGSFDQIKLLDLEYKICFVKKDMMISENFVVLNNKIERDWVHGIKEDIMHRHLNERGNLDLSRKTIIYDYLRKLDPHKIIILSD